MNTILIISLGITLVFCALIYYFLRKRINSVDQKVNLLMQLVKEHHDQVQNQSQIIMQEKHYNTPHLIAVSEDDEDGYDDDDDENDRKTSYSSDDSAEVSDSESVIDDTINIVNLTNLGDSINLESISLSGAETTQVFESSPISEVNDIELAEFKQPATDNLDELDITLDEVSLDVVNTDSVDMGDDEPTKTINLSNIETLDIRKLTVSDLKNKCKEMGLEGYSGLRKQQLVELIESQTATIGDNA
jgi:hypothetical protein